MIVSTLFVLSLVGLMSSLVSAQVLAPVGNYSVQEFSAGWTPVGANATRFTYSNPQNGFAVVQLPFDFPFDDSVLRAGTTLSVCANGVVSLVGNVAPDSTIVGSPAFPGALCIFSGNVTAGDAGNLFDSSEVTGSAPNRVLTIQYHGIHYPKSGAGQGRGAITAMQVKLYETGVIEFLYHDHNLSFSDTSSIRCGIGINGGMKGAFTSKVYDPSTKTTPATDLRWVPNTSAVKNSSRRTELSIFPNPASNRITIEDVGASRLVAVDESGRETELAVSKRGSEIEVNTSKLAAGTYVLRIEHGGKVTMRRILIAH